MMAYNYYPYAAQNYMPQNQQNQNNSLIWVQGENGAKAYLVAPNTTALLMDSEGDRFYLKTADSSGIPMPLRVFEFREVSAATQAAKSVAVGETCTYVTKSEFDALKRVVDGLAGGEKDE